jgi:hypothetical protein
LQNFVTTCIKEVIFKNILIKEKNSELLPGCSKLLSDSSLLKNIPWVRIAHQILQRLSKNSMCCHKMQDKCTQRTGTAT